MDSRVTAPGFPTPVYTVVGVASIGTSVGDVTDTGEIGCLYEPSVGATYPSGMVTSSLVHFYNAWDTRNTNNIWVDSWGSGPTGSVAAGLRNTSTTRKNMTLASFYTDFTSSQAIATASYYSQSLTKPPVEFESVFNIATTANNDYPYTVLTFGSYPRPANFTQGLWYMGPNDLADLPNATAFPNNPSYWDFFANRDGKVVMLGTYDEEVPGVGNPPRQAIYTAYPYSNVSPSGVHYNEYGGNSTIQQSAEGDPSDFSLTALKLGDYQDYNALKPRTDRLQLRVNDAVYQLTTPTWAARDIYVPADGINVLGKSYFPLYGLGNPPGTISYPDDMIYQTGSAFMYHAIYDRLLTDDEIEQNYQAFLTSSQVIVT
jgi:hypothetical protein